jgi:2,4-didehydro-3-deoxy-L-rhamnonate hydrolase
MMVYHHTSHPQRNYVKLYTFLSEGKETVGVQRQERLVPLDIHFSSMIELISAGQNGLRAVREVLASSTDDLSFEEVELLAPIPRPGKVFCSGLNYKSHVTENPNAKFLADPRFFVKVSDAVIGPGQTIRHPGMAFDVDYEVELAVVIGSPLYRTKQAEVMSHVFGYTILHDVSARAIQFKDNNEDMGKNFDTFCPMGPCIVTADEIPQPENLRLKLELNGVEMQNGTNEDWCFPIPRLLAWLSMGTTLKPGDIVSTGTPAGIGYFRNPKVFLKPGDRCRLSIDGIGVLENPVEGIQNPNHVEFLVER